MGDNQSVSALDSDAGTLDDSSISQFPPPVPPALQSGAIGQDGGYLAPEGWSPGVVVIQRGYRASRPAPALPRPRPSPPLDRALLLALDEIDEDEYLALSA